MRELIKILNIEGADYRIAILRLRPNQFTFAKQWPCETGWEEPGPNCGIFESPSAAERNAREKIDLLENWGDPDTTH